MANFQFGQDNVGSNWQVPSWYVQGMSQSPMAASIAGLGNSISAFTSGYQASRNAEQANDIQKQKLKMAEEEIKAKKKLADLEGQRLQAQQQAFTSQSAGNDWLSNFAGQLSGYGRQSDQGTSISPDVFNDPSLPRPWLAPENPNYNPQSNPEMPLFPANGPWIYRR